MATQDPKELAHLHAVENAEWRDSLDYILREQILMNNYLAC